MKPGGSSPGSNQLGASVTYSAQRISPSGFVAGAAFGWAQAWPTTPNTMSTAISTRVMSPPRGVVASSVAIAYTDAVSFAVMAASRCRHVLGFAQDFAA